MTFHPRNIVFAIAASLAATATAIPLAAQAETKLVYASYISQRSISTTMDDWFMNEVEARSKGDIVFERYYGGALMKAPDIYPGLSRGAVDFATGTPQAYNPKLYPLSNIVLPWITESADAVTYAFQELYETNADVQAEFSGKGVKLLWALPFPDGGIWTNAPVRMPADLAGLRIRSVAAIAWGIEAAGGAPIPMSFTDAVEAVSRGAIDGMANAPFDSGVKFGLPKVVAHVTDAGRLGINSVSIASMGQASFDKLTDAQKALILEVASEVPGQFVARISDAMKEAATTFLADPGAIEVHLSTDDEAAAWKALMSPVMRAKYIESVADVTANGGAIYDQFVALVQKYEKNSAYTPALATYVKMKNGG